MANKVLWVAESEAELLTTELNSAGATDTVVDGTDYANATNKFRFADFLLAVTFAANCDADAYIELHILYKLDGTHYGDGEDGDAANPTLNSNTRVGTFIIGADGATTPVYHQITGVPLSPKDFRVAVKCATGQTMASSGNTLKMYPYNEELQ